MALENVSPVIGCRVGSTHTSWHTSVNKFAVRSLISLWRTIGNPPLGQDKACSTEKLAPQAQLEGEAKLFEREGSEPLSPGRGPLHVEEC